MTSTKSEELDRKIGTSINRAISEALEEHQGRANPRSNMIAFGLRRRVR
jgi:hypothetical protein